MTKSPLRLTVLDKCKDLFYNLNLHVIKAGLFFFPFSYGEKFIAWHNSWCGGKNCNALSIYSKPQEFLRPQPNFRDKKTVVCEGWAWLLGSKSSSSLFWMNFYMASQLWWHKTGVRVPASSVELSTLSGLRSILSGYICVPVASFIHIFVTQSGFITRHFPLSGLWLWEEDQGTDLEVCLQGELTCKSRYIWS